VDPAQAATTALRAVCDWLHSRPNLDCLDKVIFAFHKKSDERLNIERWSQFVEALPPEMPLHGRKRHLRATIVLGQHGSFSSARATGGVALGRDCLGGTVDGGRAETFPDTGSLGNTDVTDCAATAVGYAGCSVSASKRSWRAAHQRNSGRLTQERLRGFGHDLDILLLRNRNLVGTHVR
jgi:hypothetical protein